MGRGDRKTRKGKRAIRSYGNVRPHNAMTTPTGPVVKKAAPAKAAVLRKSRRGKLIIKFCFEHSGHV